MTNNPNHRHGYSKKELIGIIEEIDADRNHMMNQTEKPKRIRKTIVPNSHRNMVKTDKISG